MLREISTEICAGQEVPDRGLCSETRAQLWKGTWSWVTLCFPQGTGWVGACGVNWPSHVARGS